MYIPSRVESAEAAATIAREWLGQGDSHNVLIAHKAGLGYEQLYREMAAVLDMKVSIYLFAFIILFDCLIV